MAPANFGSFSNDLLVGNFGDGHINAFDPTSGHSLGQLTLDNGQPFQEDDLWALRFGNGNGSGPTNTLFFTAGINDQKDGLFGSLQAIPTIKRHDPILPALPGAASQVLNTVAANGDVNPYGVAFVPNGFEGNGTIQPGDLLVSNFNSATGGQGTGSTIVRIAPDGENSAFFNGIPGQALGLTTALGVLKSGFVIVGNVPTDSNGNAQQGSLLILDANGSVVTQLTDSTLLNGPWDLTINDHGDEAQVFVSNVLSGTVTRIDLSIPDGGTPMVEAETQIASGYTHRTDPAALVVGPTGLAFDPSRDILYVASTGDNAVYAIANADSTRHDHGTGRVVFNDPAHLHGPLGLVLAPNGDLIASNGDAVNPDPNNLNELVEFTPEGKFVAQFQLDNTTDSSNNVIPGAAFGIALSSANGEIRLAAVDDNTNTVHTFTFLRKSSDEGDEGDDHGDGGDHGDSLRAGLFANEHHHHAGDPFWTW
jgi:sugar lactone lactonase YvrE